MNESRAIELALEQIKLANRQAFELRDIGSLEAADQNLALAESMAMGIVATIRQMRVDLSVEQSKDSK